MKNIARLLVLSMLLALVGMLVTTAAAQDGDAPGPGEGDPIIIANLGNDISTMNPILSSDGSSNTVIARLFPSLLGVSPDTLNYDIGVPATLATDLSISEDGLVYTFTLRDDWAWSDGTPITAQDYKYAYDAIASGETSTSLTYVLDDVAAVDAPDDYTLVLTLNSPVCSALENINAIPVIPSHVYQEWFPEFADMNDSPRNLGVQPATADRWEFRNFRPGEQVTLTADPDYPDAYLGYVVPEGWVFRNVASLNLIVEEFIQGNLTYLASAPADRKDEVRQLATDGLAQLYEAPASTIRFIAFNLADPSNPQPAFDEDGNPIDQGFHPLTGDVRVRQAMNYALDWEAINQSVLNGEGIQVASHVLPTSWAYNPELTPYPFDLEMADQLLTEAGFTDEDGDGIRECNGCLHAEPGTPLSMRLISNAGNTENEALGVLLQDQWAQAGIEISFEAIDFGVLVDELTSQTYDLVLIFWGFGFPDDPNGIRVTFDPQNDVIGAFNTSSYNNARVNELLDLANDPNSTDGCDVEARAALYNEALTILKEESPWIWVSTSIVTSAAQPYVENFDPRPGTTFWNEDAWIVDVAGFEAQSR